MNRDDIWSVLEVALDSGFECIKFTGGEPLLRNDITDILGDSFRLGYSNVQIVTNGFHLRRFVDKPLFRKLSLLTVSLPSLNPETFSSIAGGDYLDQVREGILKASKMNIPLRINVVLCKLNKDEILELIDFAATVNAEVKIHELLRFRFPDVRLWRSYFIPPRQIATLLEKLSRKKELVFSEGGYGSPMIKYHLGDGPGVLVFDSSNGVRYSSICRCCALFPCQDGLYALKVTHDGKLKPCWGANDMNLDVLTPLRRRDIVTTHARFKEAIETFASSQLQRVSGCARSLVSS